MGEVLAAVELLRLIRAASPGSPVFVSVATLAGRALAGERLKDLADAVFYAPLDWVFAVRRTLRRIRPNVVVVLETEIWPNWYAEIKRAGCGLVLVNGRISDRARPRYRLARWLFQAPLSRPDAILAQSEEMRRRFLEAGAPAGRVSVGGNLKYDIRPAAPPREVLAWLAALPPHRTWIAASTMPPDEEEIVIRTFVQLAASHPDLLLILAPRKPERFERTAELLRAAGVRWVRRSGLRESLALPGVLLLDTIGELSGLFAVADVVFVGGSLVPWGGHNLLEPAVFSKPIVTGPHLMNFQEMADLFRARQALWEVASAEGLAAAVAALLDDPPRARALGERAWSCAEAERGAAGRALEAVRTAYANALVCVPSAGNWLAWPLARLWQIGGVIKRRLDWWRQRRLPAPVVSVGNLAMGGTGKTPFTAWLAEALDAGVLTRGYRRQSRAIRVFARGVTASVAETGDEAQIFLRRRIRLVAIGADRFLAGQLALESGGPPCFVLDDGFQHARLHRDVDIVLVDALDPLGGGDVFPRGRLREPCAALRRADLLVITRLPEFGCPGVERWLRRWNATAPVFRVRTRAHGWVRGRGSARFAAQELPPGPCVAFCGLANPEPFRRSLRELGVRPVRTFVFPDHHRYRPGEIARMWQLAPIALTTEKDAANLGELLDDRIFWLEIGVEMDDEAAFRRALDSLLARAGNREEPVP